MDYHVTSQIPPLAALGTRSSQINQVFNAALGVFLSGGRVYDDLYKRYMGIEPRFRPSVSDCDPWVAVQDQDDSLKAMLERGTLRFGYIPGAPYVYWEGETRTGFDYELGVALTRIISAHYHDDPEKLRAEWVELTLASDEQADKLKALHQGLTEGDFDIALSGQMMLPEEYLGGLDLEWTAPTAILFTAISYTGRDREKLDQTKLEALHSGDLPAFQDYAVGESQRLDLELRIFSVFNPGPSPTSATNLVYAINHARGRAVWHTGDIPDSNTVMYTGTDHFAVGDSLASGAQSKDPRFKGIYLNVPANDELWPIAGFTAGGGPTNGPQLAVYAEHSDSKKPMTLNESLPPRDRGWNLRVFNRTEVEKGTSIRRENGTGVVILRPGLYHITTSSLVTYDDLAPQGRVTTDVHPYAGYSRLRYAADVGCGNEKAIAIGTIGTANMVPSLIDTYLEVEDGATARIVLEHQVGNDVSHLYLQGIWESSSWHVFARISIHRV
jgi:hypothetical protein